jgi:antitoxin (DNA-binding transcriptional repressor) of toxin-antitoxin stability system
MITKHGVPVAILKPVDKDKYADPKETIKKLRRFRENHNTEGISIREMIEEGRR